MDTKRKLFQDVQATAFPEITKLEWFWTFEHGAGFKTFFISFYLLTFAISKNITRKKWLSRSEMLDFRSLGHGQRISTKLFAQYNIATKDSS